LYTVIERSQWPDEKTVLPGRPIERKKEREKIPANPKLPLHLFGEVELSCSQKTLILGHRGLLRSRETSATWTGEGVHSNLGDWYGKPGDGSEKRPTFQGGNGISER